jgi:hypothetical protein
VEKPEGTGPLGRPRCRWKDIIKLDIKIFGETFRIGENSVLF